MDFMMPNGSAPQRSLRPSRSRPVHVNDSHGAGDSGFLGERIRELRKARDFTLSDIAEAAGLSLGYISQVERNLANPSVKALHDIAKVLGVNISWFFPDDETGTQAERRYIVRSDKRRVLNFGSGVDDHLLCPSLGGQLELLYSRFDPGASSGDEPYTHKGEEAGIVLSGTLKLWIDGECFTLGEGDSFNFSSLQPHRYVNPGDHETVVIWAITPPSY